MASVTIPSNLRSFCEGAAHVEVPAASIEELLRNIDARCPGFYARVVEGGILRPELAFAVGGEVIRLALHDRLEPDADITIVPALGGG